MLKPTLPYIYIFKLGSGEEIVTKVVDDNSDHYVVSKPLQLIVTSQGMQMAPYMMMCELDSDIALFKHSIFSSSRPSTNVENQYVSMTSDIILPNTKSIIAN